MLTNHLLTRCTLISQGAKIRNVCLLPCPPLCMTRLFTRPYRNRGKHAYYNKLNKISYFLYFIQAPEHNKQFISEAMF